MDWSLTSLIGMAMWAINNRSEIERVGNKVLNHIRLTESLWIEVRDLLDKIIPGVIGSRIVDAQGKSHTYDVKWAQMALNHVTGTQLVVDGEMGPRTHDAIMNYQSMRSLDPDGWLGPLTMAALDADISKTHDA